MKNKFNKLLGLIFLLQVISFINCRLYAQEYKFYIVSDTKDTVWCKEVNTAAFGKFKCVLINGENKTYKGSEVIAYSTMEKKEYKMYEKKPTNPKKPEKNLAFMEIVMQNDEYKMLNWVNDVNSAPSGTGGNVGGVFGAGGEN